MLVCCRAVGSYVRASASSMSNVIFRGKKQRQRGRRTSVRGGGADNGRSGIVGVLVGAGVVIIIILLLLILWQLLLRPSTTEVTREQPNQQQQQSKQQQQQEKTK